MRRNRRFALAAAVTAAGLLAAACSASPKTTPSKASLTTLVISDESGGTWNCVMNPLDPNDWPSGGPAETGVIYEPLMFVDIAANRPPQPWLATGYAWSNADKTLTFHIRTGVTFSNGTAMTPADVAFSFNVLKENSSADQWSLWTKDGGPLTSATAQGGNVVLTFDRPGLSDFYYAAGQVPILPQSIWSKIPAAQLVKYHDSNPVGTGAYTLSLCNQNDMVYKANPHYWQAGKPYIKTVSWPSYLQNPVANTALENGSDQWGAQFIPEYKTQYLTKNPGYRAWFPALVSVSLIPNLSAAGPLQNVKVRQAISLAINRSTVGQIGETGAEMASNQTGIAPQFGTEGWNDTALYSKYFNDYAYNPAQAEKLLEQAGYTKMAGGVRENAAGQKLSFTVTNNGGYSDWVEDVTVMEQDLAKVGIQVIPRNEAQSAWSSDALSGHFQLLVEDETGGPQPEFELRQALFSPNIGITNFSRLKDTAVDNLFKSYNYASSLTAQKAITNQLEQFMLSYVPYIPVLGAASWDEFNANLYSGWPSASDPYALGQTNFPDWGWVLLHLKPR